MPPEEPKETPGRVGSALAAAGTVGTRVWDFIARLTTLSKEQERHNRQLELLSEQIFGLAKDVQRMTGQLQGIEKRLEDKDKMVEAIIALRVREEVDKVRAELKKSP